MASLPVGKNDHSWASFADDVCNFKPILPSVFHAAIGYIERLAPADAQKFCCLGRFSRPVFSGSARAHFALSQVQDAGTVSALRHLEQRPATGLLNVIAMGGNGQDVERR